MCREAREARRPRLRQTYESFRSSSVDGLRLAGDTAVSICLFLLLPLVITAHGVGILVAKQSTPAFLATMWLLFVVLFASPDTSPFIYFQF